MIKQTDEAQPETIDHDDQPGMLVARRSCLAQVAKL
jgi:hypothetical protein